ncbi:MAG: helix-turn-helix transcriptional regulator [Sporichthyaceae bacterium]
MGEATDSGVLTFVFTDLVDSTAIAQRLGDHRAQTWRRSHLAEVRAAIDAHAGREVKNLGDGVMAVFAGPLDAVRAALEIQARVQAGNAAPDAVPTAVRIGLHTGEASCEDGDYFGTAVVVAARLCAAAEPGAILAGEVVAALVGDRVAFRAVGGLELKGLLRPQAAVEVLATAPSDAPSHPGTRPAAVRIRRSFARGQELAGRDAELDLLRAEYARAAAGELRAVVLGGEAGMGKTRLAVELLAGVDEAASTLYARAHALSAGVSFSSWAEALEPVLDCLGDDDLARLCGGFLDDLAGLFHRVAALRGPWAAGSGGDPPLPRLLAGLTRMLSGLTAAGPLVVLLDDVHWADASSWELLRHLSRRLPDAPLLLLLTARPAELAVHDTAAAALLELDQDGFLTRLDLAPLSAAELAELARHVVGAPPPPALVDWVGERSRGNALFAHGLLRALLEERADLAAPALRRLPENLAERVTARLRGSPPELMELVEFLAVAGGPLPLADLMVRTDLPLEAVGPRLSDLVAARAVTEIERGRSLSYEISHPLVRDAVYAAIGGARRRMLHQRTGRALRADGRIAEAAVHYARGATGGDPEAVEVLVEAFAEAEGRQAVAESLTLLGALVDMLPAPDARWLGVLDAMAPDAPWVNDHRADTHAEVAIAALRAIDGHLAAADPARRGLVRYRLAHFLGWGAGDVAGAHAECLRAQADFEAAGDAAGARLAERELAWIEALDGRRSAALERSRALALEAAAAGDHRAQMLALSSVATFAGTLGHLAEALAAHEAARDLLARCGWPYRRTVGANLEGWLAAMTGRAGEGRAAIVAARRDDLDYRETGSLDFEALLAHLSGDLAGALAAAAELVAWAPGRRLRRLIGVAGGIYAAIDAGQTTVARTYLDGAWETLGDREWQFHRPSLQSLEALLAWALGDPATAARDLTDAGYRLAERGQLHGGARILAEATEACAAAGDRDRAAAAATWLADSAERFDHYCLEALAAYAAAWAAPAGGPAAIAAARYAVEHFDTGDWAIWQARARYALGVALLESPSDRAEGVALLEDAAARLEACGAAWRRALVLDALRRAGTSGWRALAAALGPDSLTRREREVVERAAKGESTRDIAAALFVGERTVETHLGNAYAKLGVTSKVDLMRRAAEFDLT